MWLGTAFKDDPNSLSCFCKLPGRRGLTTPNTIMPFAKHASSIKNTETTCNWSRGVALNFVRVLPSCLGACAMTTKFLDNKISSFKFDCRDVSPPKNRVLDDFPLCPSARPAQSHKFCFYCRLAISDCWLGPSICNALTSRAQTQNLSFHWPKLLRSSVSVSLLNVLRVCGKGG